MGLGKEAVGMVKEYARFHLDLRMKERFDFGKEVIFV